MVPGVAAAYGGSHDEGQRAGGMGGGSQHRRVLVHASGFRQSPYADVKPPGENTRDTRRMLAAEESARQVGERPDHAGLADHGGDADRGEVGERRRRSEPPRKLWHASPGSSGR